jgi:hypothetical protein
VLRIARPFGPSRANEVFAYERDGREFEIDTPG